MAPAPVWHILIFLLASPATAHYALPGNEHLPSFNRMLQETVILSRVRAGVRVVQDVLSNSLPDSFFPGPMPFSNRDGYTLQVLASVQVRCSLCCTL
jgi:hypothetical protein